MVLGKFSRQSGSRRSVTTEAIISVLLWFYYGFIRTLISIVSCDFFYVNENLWSLFSLFIDILLIFFFHLYQEISLSLKYQEYFVICVLRVLHRKLIREFPGSLKQIHIYLCALYGLRHSFSKPCITMQCKLNIPHI